MTQQTTILWVENAVNQAVAIWCADPENHSEKSKMGLGQKQYTSYRIVYKQPGRDLVSMRHRYSEFETVRKDMRDRYHPLGILVPALPPKSSMTMVAVNATLSGSKADQFFIKERTFGLTLFCEVRNHRNFRTENLQLLSSFSTVSHC